MGYEDKATAAVFMATIAYIVLVNLGLAFRWRSLRRSRVYWGLVGGLAAVPVSYIVYECATNLNLYILLVAVIWVGNLLMVFHGMLGTFNQVGLEGDDDQT